MSKDSLINLLNNATNNYQLIPLIYSYLEENNVDKKRITFFINTISNNIEHQLNNSITKVLKYVTKHYIVKYGILILENKEKQPILYY